MSTTVYPPTICTRSLSHRMLKTQYSNNVDNLLTLGVNRWIGDTCLSKDCKNREMMLVFGGFALLRFSLIVVSSLPASSPPPTCPDSRCVCWAPPLLCCFFPQLNHIKDFSQPQKCISLPFFLAFHCWWLFGDLVHSREWNKSMGCLGAVLYSASTEAVR